MEKIAPRTFLLAIISTLIMGTVPVWIKAVNANAVTIGLARLAITIFLMSIIVYARKDFKNIRGRKNWGSLILIGVVFGCHWYSYFWSIKLSSASIGAISVSTFGIHLLVLNWLFKGQKVTFLDILTLLCCFAGCLLVVPEFDISSAATIGMLLGILSGFLYACLPLLHQRAQNIPTMTRTWGQSTFALLVFLPLSSQSQWQLSAEDWGMLIILGFFCTFIAHGLWVKASTELPGIVTSLVYYLYLPMTIFLSAIFLQEKITFSMGLGAAMILGANVIQSIASWKRHFL